MSHGIFTLRISTENDAFDEGRCEYEIARILREIATRIEQGSSLSGPVRDVNGNRVGSFEHDLEA